MAVRLAKAAEKSPARAGVGAAMYHDYKTAPLEVAVPDAVEAIRCPPSPSSGAKTPAPLPAEPPPAQPPAFGPAPTLQTRPPLQPELTSQTPQNASTDGAAEPMATDEQLAEGLMATIMRRAVSAHDDDSRMTCFHAVRPPAMSIKDYMLRIQRYFGCSGSCYALGLIYIDRLVKRHPDIVVSQLSCHRLLITSMMVAAKFHDDVFFSNTYYARIGGVKVQEINALEARFVQLLEWKFQVLPEEYSAYQDTLREASAAGL